MHRITFESSSWMASRYYDKCWRLSNFSRTLSRRNCMQLLLTAQHNYPTFHFISNGLFGGVGRAQWPCTPEPTPFLPLASNFPWINTMKKSVRPTDTLAEFFELGAFFNHSFWSDYFRRANKNLPICSFDTKWCFVLCGTSF